MAPKKKKSSEYNFPHPMECESLVGHSDTLRAFMDAWDNRDKHPIHPVWMLTGPRGIGKATLAYKIAKTVYGNVGDFFIVDMDRNIDKNGNVEVQAGSIKTRVKLTNLRLCESAPKKKEKKSGVSIQGESRLNMAASTRLDLRGMTVDECLIELDRFIDQGLRSGLNEFTIVHGKGTGALRTAVTRYLKASPYVKTSRLGVYGEGEDGVTIAEFR